MKIKNNYIYLNIEVIHFKYKTNNVLYMKKLYYFLYQYVQNILNQIHIKENYIRDNMKKYRN